MFLGSHPVRLDDKGRLVLPARFRDQLAEGIVIAKGQERCLQVFPVAEFRRITEAMSAAPVSSKGVRDYVRVLFAGAADEIPDRQGRITVPAPLREYARLEKDCVVNGANTRIEIWDTVAWDAYVSDTEASFADLSEEVVPGMF